MQEEATERTVGLAVQGSKMSATMFMRAIQSYLRYEKEHKKTNISHGEKVKIKDIVKDGAGVSNVEIQDKSIKEFEKLARKNGVKYAIKKDKTTVPPTFYIFFKSKDAEMIEFTLKQFTKKQLSKNKEPVIKQKLKKFAALAQEKNAKRSKLRNKEQIR